MLGKASLWPACHPFRAAEALELDPRVVFGRGLRAGPTRRPGVPQNGRFRSPHQQPAREQPLIRAAVRFPGPVELSLGAPRRAVSSMKTHEFRPGGAWTSCATPGGYEGDGLESRRQTNNSRRAQPFPLPW